MTENGEELLKIADVVKELEASGYVLRIHSEHLLEIGGDGTPILQIIKLGDHQWRASKIPNADAKGHVEAVLPGLEEVSQWLRSNH